MSDLTAFLTVAVQFCVGAALLAASFGLAVTAWSMMRDTPPPRRRAEEDE